MNTGDSKVPTRSRFSHTRQYRARHAPTVPNLSRDVAVKVNNNNGRRIESQYVRPTRAYSEPVSRRRYKRYKSFKKKVYCSNCGGRGHLFKECKKPIRSFGIVAFRVFKDISKSDEDNKPRIQVCLIRRKNTISYEAFIRGKYRLDELPIHLERMTIMEKQKIKKIEWDELYNEICYHRSSKHAQRERKKAKDLYNSINATKLFEDISSEWELPEWEFPKGRKYFDESQEECALREFREETNIDEKYVKLLSNNWVEAFEGTNKKMYQNQYYLAGTAVAGLCAG